MDSEKRMIEGYEVKTAIHMGSREFIFAVNNDAAKPYMACNCTWDNPLSIEIYDRAVVSADYLEIMTEFLNRASERIKEIEAERVERGITAVPLTAADCTPGSNRTHYKNQLIVIKPESMTPAARTADHQLVLATGGFGCNPEARGQAVFCKNLFTGKETRWERYDVAGIIRPDRMPKWAKDKLAALQKPVEKTSILGRLDNAKKDAARDAAKPARPHKDKEPEL